MTPIFMQGSKGHEAYLVLKGTVRFLCSTNDENGDPCLSKVRDHSPGDSFGELALLGLNQRKNMALAVTWVELITISESDFKAASKFEIPPHLRASLLEFEEKEAPAAVQSPTKQLRSPLALPRQMQRSKGRQTIIGGGDRNIIGSHDPLSPGNAGGLQSRARATESDLLQSKLASLSSEQKLDFMQKIGCMEMLNPYMQFHIASKLTYKFYRKEALIHKQGVKSDCLTFLYKGDVACVKSSRSTSSKKTNRSRPASVNTTKSTGEKIRGITSSQSYVNHDGVRKLGATVARLVESACFGESGVLASAEGGRYRVVEKHNSVAVTACHMLVLLPEHYKRLPAPVVESLFNQLSCRRNWEHERERAMRNKLRKERTNLGMPGALQSDSEERILQDNSRSKDGLYQSPIKSPSALPIEQRNRSQTAGNEKVVNLGGGSCWGSSDLLGSSPKFRLDGLEPDRDGEQTKKTMHHSISLPGIHEVGGSHHSVTPASGQEENTFEQNHQHTCIPSTHVDVQPADVPTGSSCGISNTRGLNDGIPDNPLEERQVPEQGGDQPQKNLEFSISLPRIQGSEGNSAETKENVVESTDSHVCTPSTNVLTVDVSTNSSPGIDSLYLSPCESVESPQKIKEDMCAGKNTNILNATHQTLRAPHPEQQLVGSMKSFEAMVHFPESAQNDDKNSKRWCDFKNGFGGSKITKPFALQYHGKSSAPAAPIVKNKEQIYRQYAIANKHRSTPERRTKNGKRKGLKKMSSPGANAAAGTAIMSIKVVGFTPQ